jgi:hypothetical protein
MNDQKLKYRVFLYAWAGLPILAAFGALGLFYAGIAR